MGNAKKVWTPEEIEQVRKLTAQGLNSTQIGARFGVTRSAISSIWRRCDIKSGSTLTPDKIARMQQARRPGFWTKEKRDRVQTMLVEGWSMRAIGEAFKVNPSTISNLAKKHGLKGVRCSSEKGREQLKRTMPDIPTGDTGLHRFAEGYQGQSGKVSVSEHRDHQCRYPVDQSDGSVKFCGDRASEGSAYCPTHQARCCTGRLSLYRAPKARVAA